MIYPWRWVVPLLLLIFLFRSLSQLNYHAHILALNKNNNILSVTFIVFYFLVYHVCSLWHMHAFPHYPHFHIRLTCLETNASQTTYDTCLLSHYVTSRHPSLPLLRMSLYPFLTLLHRCLSLTSTAAAKGSTRVASASLLNVFLYYQSCAPC